MTNSVPPSSSPAASVRSRLASLLRPASQVVVLLGRCGFVARGLIYLAVGVLAGLAALGEPRGEATDPQGAVTTIEHLPLGEPLVVLTGLGLSGYALWRFVQAVFNLERFQGRFRGLGWRLWFGLDGLFHTGFAIMVFAVARGSRSGTTEAEADQWAQRIFLEPWGRWMLFGGGLLMIAIGAYVIMRAFTIRHRDYLQRRIEHAWQATAVVTASRVGESARAVVFVIIGAFLLKAGITYDPQKTVGLAGALHALAGQPGGRLWLGLVALGLIAYGILSGLEARYRRIGTGDPAPEN